VSFFPTAICEDECGAPRLPGGSTNARGEGTLQVRVPGAFLGRHDHHVYFRDRERIDVEVTWEGADGKFAAGSAEPEPIIVRDHGRGRAPAALAAGREQLPIPPGFRLAASNGYTMVVSALGPTYRRGTLLLTVVKKGREVGYEAPATVTETSIHANLGARGEISVEFQRSDRAVSVECGKEPVRFDSGSWTGTIDFHGEDGYTEVEATSAPGDIDYALGPICGGFSATESSSARGRGAELIVRNPGLGAQLSVYKSRPGAAALISADLSEYVEGISIHRSTAAWMPGRDFSYAPDLRTATVTPPGPFSGTARFDLGEKAGRRWSGDLTVDMPGRDDVPLTGPLLRAALYPSE
jgi:hypothetical protein